MTRERFDEIVARLQGTDDITVFNYNGVMHITFEDFDGLDENYNELEREIVEPVLYKELEDFLHEVLDWSFYGTGVIFDGLELHVGYSSYDI